MLPRTACQSLQTNSEKPSRNTADTNTATLMNRQKQKTGPSRGGLIRRLHFRAMESSRCVFLIRRVGSSRPHDHEQARVLETGRRGFCAARFAPDKRKTAAANRISFAPVRDLLPSALDKTRLRARAQSPPPFRPAIGIARSGLAFARTLAQRPWQPAHRMHDTHTPFSV